MQLRLTLAALAAALFAVPAVAETFETSVAAALSPESSFAAELKAQKAVALETTAELRSAVEAVPAILSTEETGAELVLARDHRRGPGRRRWCERRYEDCRWDCRREHPAFRRRCLQRCEWDYRRCVN